MNLPPDDDFPDLLECLIDGTATRGQLFSLSKLLQANADLRRQVRSHLMVAEALAVMMPGRDAWRDPWGEPPRGAAHSIG